MATNEPEDDVQVAVEIERMRGDLGIGLSRIEGRLDLLVQANNSLRSDIEDLETGLSEVDSRVSALEARRLPWGLLASLAGVVSAATAAVALLIQL